jgi:signal transduction histidine kinase
MSVAVFGGNAVFLIAGRDGGDRPAWPWGWLLQLVSAAALSLRHRHPWSALAITGSAALLYYPLGFPDSPLGLAFAIVAFTVARDGRRGLAAGGTLLVLAGFPLITLARGGSPGLDTTVGQVVILGAAVVAGEITRARRERAEALVRDRENQERLRIARELHDVMAHQISLISVQAGAALHRRDPDAAFEALEHIRAASGAALREFRTVRGMLRTDASLADRLPDLLAGVRATGLEVRLTGTPPDDLPAALDATAFRIVQESLSNAVNHARPARVTVSVDRRPGELVLDVHDEGQRVARPARNGSGLLGMRERAASVGGEVDAGPAPGGGWHVTATLPDAR